MDIDEILDKAKSVVNTAAKKAEEVVEVSKLKFETVKHSNAAADLYEKLGRVVYEDKKKGYSNDELISTICEEIDEKNKSLDDLATEIADRKNQKICPVCGSKNSKDNCYCAKCGAKIMCETDEKPCDDEPEFTDTVKEKAEDFAKTAHDVAEEVCEKAKDFAESFNEKHMSGENTSDFVEAQAHEVKDTAENVAEDIKDNAKEVADDVAQSVKDTVQDVKDDLNK